jgi:hypothetical protein
MNTTSGPGQDKKAEFILNAVLAIAGGIAIIGDLVSKEDIPKALKLIKEEFLNNDEDKKVLHKCADNLFNNKS